MNAALNIIAKARSLIEARNPDAAWHVLRTADRRLLPEKAAAKVAAAIDTLTNGTSQTADRLLAEAQKIATGRKPRGYWSKERVLADAAQHTTRDEWKQASRGAHKAACLNGWLHEAQAHMEDPGWWMTLEECKRSASQFATRKAWQQSNISAYSRAHKQGWLEQCCEHMPSVRVKRTMEDCQKAAAVWGSRGAWAKGDPNSYQAASRAGWIDACMKKGSDK